MTDQELTGVLVLGAYVLTLVAAVRVFGLRRVLLAFVLITVFGLSIAFRALGAITSAAGRRY